MVKSAIVCLCPFFFVFFHVFAKITSEHELFVSKVGFEIFVEVIGVTYVFEDG